MSSIQAFNPNVQYQVIPAMPAEEKNLIEGVMWGVNGVINLSLGIGTVAGTLTIDTMALGLATISPPELVLTGAIGLAALNVLALYVTKAEISIASKSFKHMQNTIF